VDVVSTALAKTEPVTALARVEELDLGVPVEQLIARVEKIREVQKRVMKLDVHYGNIPGVKKPSLFKPGAEMLGMTFQLAPTFKTVEHYDGDHLEVVVTCTLTHIPTSLDVGSGLGSCSTKETKYAYRQGERKCPKCGEAAIIKGKEQYGGGWLCWNKPEKNKHGCGAKFADGDKSIEGQEAGRVANPDLADAYNTVRKMACKRAHVAAILFACGASDLFTQDVEDMPRGENDGGGGDEPQQQRQQEPRRSQNGERPDDNRGRQQTSIPTASPESTKATARLLEAMESAQAHDDLEPLSAELQMLKNERVLTIDDYRKLKAALGHAYARVNNESSAPVGATS
jgi:hypothetical protein